ncbi:MULTISPECIES: DoxX family protein [Streptomycetaceae]|uniref:DoxX family protein n=1 Tax=Streptomycetaceae TaxID=2062 RepID=UPI0030082742
MHVAYWVLAVLLAVFYAYSGGKKLVQDRDRLRPMMGWVDQVPMARVRAIGAVELLGALGLLLPPLTGVAVGLAVAAAIGLALVQVGAGALHLSRGEVREIGLNVALLVVAAVAAWAAASLV